MSGNKRMPHYIDVDGYRVTGNFLPDAVRGFLKYKPKAGEFFVVTFPKSGTTWAQQIVTLIFDKGISVTNYTEFNHRSPFIEMCGVEAIDLMNKPGAMKIHTPYYRTPMSSEAKYLYVVRNPKDTLVSFYHHTRSRTYNFESGTLDEFFEIFMNGENDYGEYFDHVLSWYEHRHDPNVMFLFYEEIKMNTPNAVRKIAKFMGEEYADLLENDEEVFKNVLKYCSLEYMKCLNIDLHSGENKAGQIYEGNVPPGLNHVLQAASRRKAAPGEVFKMVRNGKVGEWRSTLSEEQNCRLDEKIEKKLKGTEMYNFWKELNCI